MIVIGTLALTALLFLLLRPVAEKPASVPESAADRQPAYSQFSPSRTPSAGQRRQPGDRAPRAELNDINSGQKIVTPRRGQRQVLEFIATWCQYCQKMTPLLSRELRRAGNTELIVVGAARENDQQLRQFVNKFSPAGRQPLVVNDRQLAFADQYQLSGYPTTVFINKRGKITSIIVGAQSRAVIRAAIADNRG
jgi:thiol-disulfide isomerase/thioredoxin